MIDALHIGEARVAVYIAERPTSLDDLAPRERLQALRLPQPRQRDYLLGRAALRQALAAAGLAPDTGAIAMPHPRLSLSHGGGIAVAGWSDVDALGVGIDWEAARRVDPAVARFFLTDRERALVDGDADAPLRLWTVKEALYKATPHNAELTLRMFEVADPAAACGHARLACRPTLAFRYATHRDGGFLSAALAFGATTRTRP